MPIRLRAAGFGCTAMVRAIKPPRATVMDATTLYDHLAAVLGTTKVSRSTDDLAVHATDKWNASHPPDVVVFAESTADVVAVMEFASAHGIPVTTRGAGVGYVGGCVPIRGGIVLSVARMNRILEINPGDGVAVVQPGVITKAVGDAAWATGWYYPPDPASLKDSSIGGNIATNAGGPRCLKYGVTRHYVLGLEVVLADGTVLRTGGRVHKNKTGLDLTALFVGSEGVLGVVTEATLRLIPAPPSRGMLAAVFPDFAAAAACVQGILGGGHLPSALEITDAYTLRAARAYLGADALPDGGAHLIVETDGRPATVRDELTALQAVLLAHGASGIDRAEDDAGCERIWKLRREFSNGLRHTGLTKLNEDIVVPRSRLVDLVVFCDSLAKESGLPIACFGHAGDGNIHANVMVADYQDPATRKLADSVVDRLFQWVLANKGAITGEHGIGMAKLPWISGALGEAGIAVHRALKAALDPRDVLNPGKLIP